MEKKDQHPSLSTTTARLPVAKFTDSSKHHSQISSATMPRRPQVQATTNSVVTLKLKKQSDELEAQRIEIADLKEYAAGLKQDIVVLEETETARRNLLKTMIKTVQNLESQFEVFNEAVAGLLDKNREESSSDSGEGEAGMKLVEKEKIETSLTVYDDPSFKELTRNGVPGAT